MAYSEPKVTIDLAHYNELIQKCNQEFGKPEEKNKYKNALESVYNFIDVEIGNIPVRGRMQSVADHFAEILKDNGIEIILGKTANGPVIHIK